MTEASFPGATLELFCQVPGPCCVVDLRGGATEVGVRGFEQELVLGIA